MGFLWRMLALIRHQVQSDLKELQEKLVKLTEDLEAEKKEKNEILIKADKLTKAVINASPILLKSFQDIIFDKKLDFDTEEKNAISALFMIALGFIPIEKIKNYVENYGSITINEKVYFKCTKYTEKLCTRQKNHPHPIFIGLGVKKLTNCRNTVLSLLKNTK